MGSNPAGRASKSMGQVERPGPFSSCWPLAIDVKVSLLPSSVARWSGGHSQTSGIGADLPDRDAGHERRTFRRTSRPHSRQRSRLEPLGVIRATGGALSCYNDGPPAGASLESSWPRCSIWRHQRHRRRKTPQPEPWSCRDPSLLAWARPPCPAPRGRSWIACRSTSATRTTITSPGAAPPMRSWRTSCSGST